jgi:hypothetical protein
VRCGFAAFSPTPPLDILPFRRDSSFCATTTCHPVDRNHCPPVDHRLRSPSPSPLPSSLASSSSSFSFSARNFATPFRAFSAYTASSLRSSSGCGLAVLWYTVCGRLALGGTEPDRQGVAVGSKRASSARRRGKYDQANRCTAPSRTGLRACSSLIHQPPASSSFGQQLHESDPVISLLAGVTALDRHADTPKAEEKAKERRRQGAKDRSERR